MSAAFRTRPISAKASRNGLTHAKAKMFSERLKKIFQYNFSAALVLRTKQPERQRTEHRQILARGRSRRRIFVREAKNSARSIPSRSRLETSSENDRASSMLGRSPGNFENLVSNVSRGSVSPERRPSPRKAISRTRWTASSRAQLERHARTRFEIRADVGRDRCTKVRLRGWFFYGGVFCWGLSHDCAFQKGSKYVTRWVMDLKNNTSLKNKVAIVTGASRGIGKAIAIELASRGTSVVLAAKTIDPNPKLPGTLEDVKREIESKGGRALIQQTDVRSDADVEALITKTVAELGGIDILINNAGALYWADVENTPMKRFDLVMGVNVRASFACAQVPSLT